MGQLAWASAGDNAQIHYSTPDAYYEVFDRKGSWITLTGWGNQTPYGPAYYQIVTNRAFIFVNGAPQDLTPVFGGSSHPYALENVPAQDYQVYVEGTLVEYLNWRPTGNRMTFSWYVNWSHPTMGPSSAGSRMGVLQSEEWHDSKGGLNRQSQFICQGIGYACWRQANNAQPDSTAFVWYW
jgi:hypothetical protein